MRGIQPRIRFRVAGTVLVVALGLGAAACSSSSKSGVSQPGSTTSGVAGTSVPPGYAGQSAAPTAAVDAIRAYELKHGPAIGSWTITSVQVSAVDPTYVLYRISATPGHTNVQPGYGFAHSEGTTWSVIAFGSDAVGCPPGAAGNRVVPTTVLAGFRVSCPG